MTLGHRIDWTNDGQATSQPVYVVISHMDWARHLGFVCFDIITFLRNSIPPVVFSLCLQTVTTGTGKMEHSYTTQLFTWI